MSIVYVDIESTGLNPNVHEVTEIGWVIDGVSDSIVLPHTLATFEQAALDVSQYHSRELWDMGRWCMPEDIRDLREKLQGVTLAGCNPHFDAMFLGRLFGGEVWHYRLLDVAVYAAAVLGEPAPLGAHALYERFTELGWHLTKPDHSAQQDALFAHDLHHASMAYLSQMQAKGL